MTQIFLLKTAKTYLRHSVWLSALAILTNCQSPPQDQPLLFPHSLWSSSPPHTPPQKPSPSPQPSTEIPPAFKKPISLNIQENTPLKEMLLELCQKEKINLVMHSFPERRPPQTYICFQKPFLQVVSDLCALTHMRFRLEGHTIYLEEDTPYIHTYIVPFPVGARQIQNQTNVLTNVLGSAEGHHPHNNSHTYLSETTLIDFWGELERVLQFILKASPAVSSQEEASPSSAPPSTVAAFAPSLPLNPDTSQRRTVRLLTTLPLDNRKKNSPKKDTSPSPSTAPQISSSVAPYALHKQVGLVSVYGTKRQHDLIDHYLKRLKKLAHAQITIEAQILEVLLKENFKSGIDWQLFGKHLNVHILSSKTQETPFLTCGIKGSSFSGVITALSHFGTIRTLSNPRLTVLNNQPALMKVAKNEVFFQLEVDRVLSSDNKPDLETTTSRMQTIPIGLVLVVQPSIDPDTQEITLSLRPTLSRVIEMRNDPAVSIRSDNKIHSSVPVVQMREFDSILKVHSHDTVLMGGLMEKYQAEEKTNLPGITEMPLLERFFSEKEQLSTTSELIIMLKVWLEEERSP